MRQEVSAINSPRIDVSIPVRGKILVNLFFSNTNLADVTERSIYGKLDCVCQLADGEKRVYH